MHVLRVPKENTWSIYIYQENGPWLLVAECSTWQAFDDYVWSMQVAPNVIDTPQTCLFPVVYTVSLHNFLYGGFPFYSSLPQPPHDFLSSCSPSPTLLRLRIYPIRLPHPPRSICFVGRWRPSLSTKESACGGGGEEHPTPSPGPPGGVQGQSWWDRPALPGQSAALLGVASYQSR
jgi:hypothetical protein